MLARYATRRTIAILLVTALAVSALAPAASADRGRRYKGRGPVVREVFVRHPRSHVVVRGSSAAPVIAGFLGGLILGATMTHAAPPPDYYYWDPYCHERFASLEIYGSHIHRHRHPGVVRVIEVRTGECAYDYRYDEGRWYRDDDDGCDRGGAYRDRDERWDDRDEHWDR